MRKRKKSGLDILGLGKQRQDRVVSKGVADSCCSLIPVCSSASSRRPCSPEGPCEQLRPVE